MPAFIVPPRPAAWGRDLYGRRRDGSEVPVEIGLTPIQTDAGLLVLHAIVDITERKQAEETRRDLAHASRLTIVGELTASIAHEINQPLGAILSNADAAEMLLATSPAPLDEVRQILDDIRKDDLRASEVIRRLRTLLQKHELEMLPLNLNEVTSEVLTLVRLESLPRGVTVETDLAVDLPEVRGVNPSSASFAEPRPQRHGGNGGRARDQRLAVRTVLSEDRRGGRGRGRRRRASGRIDSGIFSTHSLRPRRRGWAWDCPSPGPLSRRHGGLIWAENNPGGGAMRPSASRCPRAGPQAGKASPGDVRASLELIA